MRKQRDSARIRLILLTFLTCFFYVTSAPAQESGKTPVNTTVPQKIIITVGKSLIVESLKPVERATVAAPEIADAVMLSPRQIYVTGKNPGNTTLTVWQSKEKETGSVFDIAVMVDISGLKNKLHEIFPQEENIKVTSTPDGIVLTGTVAGPSVASQVLILAESYAPRDKNGKSRISNLLETGGVHQVMLEVRVSEMGRSTMKRLGFNWNYVSDSGQQFGISLLDNLTRLPGGGIAGNALNVSDNVNLIFRFLGAGASWTMLIDALKENGLTKVLAEPTLITQSGKTADFLAGGEFPIPVPQAAGSNVVITVEYKPFGVGLKFTPTVLSNGKISMQVTPEVSELDFSQAISLQGFILPSLTTRRVSTIIELGEGQSFAIAGLLRDDVREVVRKFPVIGDIPVLGALFRSSSFQKNETELVVIVTPRLVKPVDVKKQTLPTDAYIEPDDAEFYLFGFTEGRADQGPPPRGLPSSDGKNGGLDGRFGHIIVR